jgi:pimeloyl-ACP methyl ester carboxylesterase
MRDVIDNVDFEPHASSRRVDDPQVEVVDDPGAPFGKVRRDAFDHGGVGFGDVSGVHASDINDGTLLGYGLGVQLNTIRRGSGDPIVFIHGMGTAASTWDACAEALADRYLTIAVDLPGHGDSPCPEDRAAFTRDAALADLDLVLAELGGPAVLVGHSLGGYWALAHAATRPNVARGIVVLNTGPGFRDPEKREGWNDRSRRNAHRFGVPERVVDLNLQQDSVVMDRLAETTTPTLVLAGGADRPEYTGSGQYLERKMPDARLVVLDGGGHSMHEDTHAIEVATLVADFTAALPDQRRRPWRIDS